MGVQFSASFCRSRRLSHQDKADFEEQRPLPLTKQAEKAYADHCRGDHPICAVQCQSPHCCVIASVESRFVANSGGQTDPCTRRGYPARSRDLFCLDGS